MQAAGGSRDTYIMYKRVNPRIANPPQQMNLPSRRVWESAGEGEVHVVYAMNSNRNLARFSKCTPTGCSRSPLQLGNRLEFRLLDC